MRILVILFLMLASADASASGDMEQVRRRTNVEYVGGDFVEVSCRDVDRCSLTVAHHGTTTVLEEADLNGLMILPSHLALVGASVPGWSVVEVEIGCAEYPEFPPVYICLAQLEIKDGALVTASIFKRTVIDSSDVQPFRSSTPNPVDSSGASGD